jgi:hypothetical protein
MGRRKRPVCFTYKEFKERCREGGLNISVNKTKYKIVETRKISEIVTVKDDHTKGVRNIKYLWTVINNTDD